LLGYEPHEWLQIPNFWLSIVHPEDRDRAMREAHGLYRAGFGGVIEFRWIGRDGREVWVESHVRTIQDRGLSTGMRGVALDVTARKRLELERADLLAQTQASNRAKDEFIATVSHELRTPINAVLGWTQMLRAGILAPDRVERALEAIDRNAAAQSRMIEDLLDVSRIASGKFRMEFEDVDLVTLARLAVDVVRPAADGKGLSLELVTPDVPARLLADPQRLEQAIWNLLSNAVKFTPAGGRVSIEVGVDSDHLTLAVSDTGEGIAPDILPHIFERFRQGDASVTRAHAGLGIGLALVRHIVGLHGGTVRAASGGRGQGTTFRVRLPRQAVDEAEGIPASVAAAPWARSYWD
jgi:PAS domain S-box-containing protein